MGIVGGELRVDASASVLGQQEAHTDQVADVGGGLAGEHRIAFDTQFLGFLDLAVPVGALDQTQRDLVALQVGDAVQVLQGRQGTRRVGLHDEAELAPATAGVALVDGAEHLQRDLEAIDFLGIDGDGDVQLAGDAGQFTHACHQLFQHLLTTAEFIARVQGGQLDGHGR